MNQREQIRAVMREHGPMSVAQMAERMGVSGHDRKTLSAQMRDMARGGTLTRAGDGRLFVYALSGKAVRPILSKISRRPGGTAQLIREVLRSGPATTGEIRIATGITRSQASSAMNDMERAGIIGHDGGPQGYRRYKLLRDVPDRMTQEERKRARAERQAKYYRAKQAASGGRTMDEIRAAAAAKKAEARRQRGRTKAKRDAQKKAEAKAREERQQAKRAALLAKLEAAPVTQVAEAPRLMSSAEWNGPIQRLEPWEVSKPLRITREVVRRMAA